MAKCGRCKTIKHDSLISFGGVAICDYCYDEVNPQLITYKLMPPSSVVNVENELMKLRKQVRVYERMLEINNELIQKGETTITKRIPRNT